MLVKIDDGEVDVASLETAGIGVNQRRSLAVLQLYALFSYSCSGHVESVGGKLLGTVCFDFHSLCLDIGHFKHRSVKRSGNGERNVYRSARRHTEVVDEKVLQLGVGILAVEHFAILILLYGGSITSGTNFILVRSIVVVAVIVRRRPFDGQRYLVGLALVELDVFARPVNRDFRLVTREEVVYIVVAGCRRESEQSYRHGLKAVE